MTEETILLLIKASAALWITIIAAMIVWSAFYHWSQSLDYNERKAKRSAYLSTKPIRFSAEVDRLLEPEEEDLNSHH